MKKIRFLGIVVLSVLSFLTLSSCDMTSSDESDFATIYFNSNISKGVDKTVRVKIGNTLDVSDIPTYKRNNYYFEGWYDDFDIKYDFSLPIFDNVTVNAKWTVKTVSDDVIEHTVRYEFMHNNLFMEDKIVDGKTAKYYFPKREGYTFKGWKTRRDLTESYDFSRPITSDVTLYAKWFKDLAGIEDYNPNDNDVDNGSSDNHTPAPSPSPDIGNDKTAYASDMKLDEYSTFDIEAIDCPVVDKSSSKLNYTFTSEINAKMKFNLLCDIYNDYILNSFSGTYEGNLKGSASFNYKVMKDKLTMTFSLKGSISGDLNNYEINQYILKKWTNTFSTTLYVDISGAITTDDNGKMSFSTITKLTIKKGNDECYSVSYVESCGAELHGANFNFEGNFYGSSKEQPRKVNYGLVSDSVKGTCKTPLYSYSSGDFVLDTSKFTIKMNSIIYQKKD